MYLKKNGCMNNFSFECIYLIVLDQLAENAENNSQISIECLTSGKITMQSIMNTVERLRLRPMVCLNVSSVSICNSFRFVVYVVYPEVQHARIFRTLIGIVTILAN